MSETRYGRGRPAVNNIYIDGMAVGVGRVVPWVTPTERGKIASGIHEACFRRGWGVETGYDSAEQILNYRRIK
jgi:hypothetical protein